MTVFNILDDKKEPRYASYWLESASVNGKRISCDGKVRDFILKLEAMNAKLSYSDLGWMNDLCQRYFGRNYQTVEQVEEAARVEEAKEFSHLLNNTDRTKSRR